MALVYTGGLEVAVVYTGGPGLFSGSFHYLLTALTVAAIRLLHHRHLTVTR